MREFYILATCAYEDLITILKHPNFNVLDAVSNVRRVRQWQQRLPLQKVRSHQISITSKNTPSTASPSRDAYIFSLHETIERVLNNPFLMSKMYFGPGIESDEKSELWHGDIWKRSPLFGENKLETQNGKFV